MTEKIGIKVGHDAGTIEAARDAVMRILEARADQKTIRAALRAFDRVASINGMTISGCSVDQSEKHNHPDRENDGTYAGYAE